MVQIDRSNVQGLIFRSYNYPFTRHFLFQFANTQGARGFLGEWVPHVTHAAQNLDPKPDPLLNIALTWSGLNKTGALDVPSPRVPASLAFPGDFREPPNAHAMRDLGKSAPENWWNKKFKSEDVDVMLWASCQSEESRAKLSDAIRTSAAKFGIKELLPMADGQEAITGYTAPKGILHFGYRDGISQPEVNWDDLPNRPDLVDLRWFLLGYGNKDIESTPGKPPWNDLVRDGCYMVLRWVYQDVAKFNKFLRERSAALWPQMDPADAQELLAAKMMGRWRNGTPLVLFPDGPEADRAKFMANNFSYAMDPDGERCPFNSHIRIVHRRDDPLKGANPVIFPPGTPRVLRRGSSYGPPLQGEQDDEKDRGLIGMFLCTNIESQFFVLMRWINETDFHAKVTNHHGQDPLFGNRKYDQRTDTFEFAADGKQHALTGLQDFIRTKGTLMLFVPSLTALKQMSA
jgi:Dyp-type peroxidase family